MSYAAEADGYVCDFFSPAPVATDSKITGDNVVRYKEEDIFGLTVIAVSSR